MTVEQCECGIELSIISLNIDNRKLKLRLYEIGFFVGSKIKVLKRSFLKKTLLIHILDSCFILKSSIAKMIEVEYE
jgi:Fe2+ transport system protein FeoA